MSGKRSLGEVLAPAVPIVLVVLGPMLIAVGIALVYVPAGVVVLGLEMLVFEYYIRVRGSEQMQRSFLETLLNRAPVAYAPTASNAPFLGLFTGGNSREQELAAMEGVSTLFSVVDLLAENVSQSEWKLWRKAPSGRKEDRTEVTR